MEYSSRSTIMAENVHPYLTFKSHSTGINNESELVVMEAIRKAHPGAHITPISEQDVDIFGWAKAGNAQLTALQDNEFSLFRRKYRYPRDTSNGSDALYDRDIFRHYQLEYDDHTLEMYVAEWAWTIMGKKMRLFYLVAPKAKASFVDDMLLSIARWTSHLHDKVYVFDGGDWNKDQKLWRASRASYRDDVILDPAIKQSLLDDVLRFFSSQAMYTKYGIPWKRGLILHGPPGNGKTMAIRSLMNTLHQRAGISTMVVKSFRSCDDPESGIQFVFEYARDMAPCLLVFEDLDSLVTDAVRSYFLNQIDGIDSNEGILIIASTNHVDRLDSSISKRPSRFDKKYHFQLPDKAARIKYCEHWRAKLRENDDVVFEAETSELIADLTDGFSFAYLKELMIQCLFSMVADGLDESDSGDDVRKMVTTSVPGVEVADVLLNTPFVRAVCKQVVVLREDMKAIDH